MTRKKKHIHRYERVILGKNNYIVFRCNYPDCAHYVSEELAKGRTSICNRCGGEMILDTRAMRFVKPYCPDCVRTMRSPEHDKILDYIEKNAT